MGDSGAPKVTYDDQEYNVIKEGLAEILVPQGKCEGKPSKAGTSQGSVFYNPIQQFNRDLSILAVRVFADDFDLLRKRKTQPVDRNPAPKKRKRAEGEDEQRTESTKKSRTTENGAVEPTDAQTGSDVKARQTDAEQPKAAQHCEPEQTSTDAPKETSKHHFRILDALSATGLRALRYSKEIEQVTLVTANDLSAAAVDAIKLHVKHNGLAGKVHPLVGNAIAHMDYLSSLTSPVLPDGSRGKYHVIDLDPYGTASPFLDAAVQSIQDGGLLCVTCTDSAIFASHGYLEKTFSQYGGLPIQGPHSHEGGLRLALHAIATSAARYGWAIEPLLSLSIDFYIRVFVRLRRSPAEVKLLGGKTIEVFGCDHGCGSWSIQPLVRTQTFANKNGTPTYKFTASQAPTAGQLCQHCGFKTHLAGPMWGGPLHNPYFIQRMIDMLPSLDKEAYGTIPRMEGMLTTARDEVLLPQATAKDEKPIPGADIPKATSVDQPIPRLPPADRDLYPFFIIPSALAKVLHCPSPSRAEFRSALLKLNYRVTRSHVKSGTIRTDAPWNVIWEVMREWVRQRAPLKKDATKPGTAGAGIMRNDRSKHKLTALRNEVSNILHLADDATEVKEKLQALLWRLEPKFKTEERSEEESGATEQVKEGTTNAENSGRDAQSLPSTNDLEVVFDGALGKEWEEKKLVRYQENPRENWGPQTRARG